MMNVLSLFDGMSCGQIALNRIGVTPGKYYAAEIDKYAIKVTQANYPNTIQLGSVTEWREWDLDWSTIDLVSGGFPCQAWSMAGKQLGDKDDRGMLFWVMLDIIKHAKQANPKIKFLIENVKMKKEFEDYITDHTEQALGQVNKVLINSALVSAQNRRRFYWTNWHVEQPEDKGIVLADVIEGGFVDRDNSHCIDANYYKGGNLKSYFEKHRRQLVFLKQRPRGNNLGFEKEATKAPTITANSWEHNLHIDINNCNYSDRSKAQILKNSKTPDKKAVAVCTNSNTTGSGVNVITYDNRHYRKLTPTECERLQTVPDGYTNHVSNTQRYKMLGNGWTVDVIAHILREADL
jgi:DNA-cytosine methyltransferase